MIGWLKSQWEPRVPQFSLKTEAAVILTTFLAAVFATYVDLLRMDTKWVIYIEDNLLCCNLLFRGLGSFPIAFKELKVYFL